MESGGTVILFGKSFRNRPTKLIKEEKGRVALDYDADLKNASELSGEGREYKLPTGAWISVKEECLKCPELLFNPSLQ